MQQYLPYSKSNYLLQLLPCPYLPCHICGGMFPIAEIPHCRILEIQLKVPSTLATLGTEESGYSGEVAMIMGSGWHLEFRALLP